MLNNPLGTYAENTNHRLTTALYSVQPAYACIVAASYCRSDARSTIALESTGALISCMHETGYPHGLYKTDRGHRSYLSKENSFSFVHGIPFSFTPKKQVCTGFVVALRLAIPIDRNGEAQGQA